MCLCVWVICSTTESLLCLLSSAWLLREVSWLNLSAASVLLGVVRPALLILEQCLAIGLKTVEWFMMNTVQF